MNHEWQKEPIQKLTFLDERVNKVLKSLLIFLIPIIVVLGSVSMVTTDSYLTYEYGRLNFPADAYRLTPQQRFIMASTNIHYVQAHLPGDELSRQTLNGAQVYNEREVSHMEDVRAVFQSMLRVWQLAFLVFALVGVVLWRNGQRMIFFSGALWGGILTAGLILMIGVLNLSAFWAQIQSGLSAAERRLRTDRCRPQCGSNRKTGCAAVEGNHPIREHPLPLCG